MKKIAIIDDHFATRNGYKEFIKTFDFVGSVDVFENSIDFYNKQKVLKYDLVVLDIELKTENGIDICLQLKSAFGDIKVLILSAFHSHEYIISSYKYGADGFVFKDSESGVIKNAIEEIIVNNGKYFEDNANRIIFNLMHSEKSNFNLPVKLLTEREMEVLILVCKGKSHKEIANSLLIKENTIATHKQNMMKKLDLHKTVELYNWAQENGVFSPLKISKKNLS